MKEKQRKIGTISHAESGIEVDYFLRGTRFVARVLEEEVSAPEAAILTREVRDRLDHWLKMDWYPIIETEIETRWQERKESANVEIKIRRYWLSRSPAGLLRTCEWEVDEVHRKAKMNRFESCRELNLTKLPLGVPLTLRSGKTMIDYDDQLWRNLLGIVASIRAIRERLQTLLTSKAGIAQIGRAKGALLLKEK
jgi:hypothetical protein